ncbi:MAG: PPC domain-containing protein [Bryobacteraceae bacterium]
MGNIKSISNSAPPPLPIPDLLVKPARPIAVSAPPARAPVISGFAPIIANVGDPITISGTSLEDSPIKHTVRMNLGLATVIATTATTITTTVPAGAASGRISLATPRGRAISTGDLFVVPAGYGPGSVAFTGRMAIGGAFSGRLEVSRRLGLVVFDGTAGEKLSLNVTGAIGGAKLQIQKPNGAALTQTEADSGGRAAVEMILPADGTYTVMIAGNGDSAGTVKLGLAASGAPR